jgi:hypothetical protein
VWSLLPFNNALRNANLRFGSPNDDSFAAALSTWDAQHYIRLAEVGYQPGLLTNAFAPLYPMSIRALNLITGDSIVSGLLIANLASGIALYLLYRFVRGRYGREVGWNTLLLFLAFPTAFYLNLIYTEGLFLLLTTVFFIALYRRNLPIAAVCAFLLPFLRLPGLVVTLPLAWVLIGDYLSSRRIHLHTGPNHLSVDGNGSGADPLAAGFNPQTKNPRLADFSPQTKNLLYLLAPLAGLLAYFAYMHFEIGNAFIAMDAEKLYISNRSLENLLRPWHLFPDLFRTHLSVHGYLDSALDRAFFVAMVASLPLIYRRTGMPMFLFAAVILLQPFLGSFMSYTRLAMVAFPLYIAWATVFTGPRARYIHVLIYPLSMLQALLLSMHVLSYWVA